MAESHEFAAFRSEDRYQRDQAKQPMTSAFRAACESSRIMAFVAPTTVKRGTPVASRRNSRRGRNEAFQLSGDGNGFHRPGAARAGPGRRSRPADRRRAAQQDLSVLL